MKRMQVGLRHTCASPLDDVVEMRDSVVSVLTVSDDLSSNFPALLVLSNITDAADRRCCTQIQLIIIIIIIYILHITASSTTVCIV